MVEAAPKQKYLTLILGAGASMPYDFPSGAQLVRDIIREAEQFSQRSLDLIPIRNGQINPPVLEDYEAVWTYFNSKLYPGLPNKMIAKVSETIADQLTLYQPTSIDSYLGNLYSAQDEESKIHADLCKYYICKSIAEHYDLRNYRIRVKEDQPKWL